MTILRTHTAWLVLVALDHQDLGGRGTKQCHYQHFILQFLFDYLYSSIIFILLHFHPPSLSSSTTFILHHPFRAFHRSAICHQTTSAAQNSKLRNKFEMLRKFEQKILCKDMFHSVSFTKELDEVRPPKMLRKKIGFVFKFKNLSNISNLFLGFEFCAAEVVW